MYIQVLKWPVVQSRLARTVPFLLSVRAQYASPRVVHRSVTACARDLPRSPLAHSRPPASPVHGACVGHAIQGIIARAITSRNHRASVPRRGQGACIFPAARDSKVAVPRGPVPLCTRRAKLSIPMGFLLTARREFDWFPPHRLRMHRCVPLAGILLLACRRADIRRRRAYEMSSRNEFSSRWRLRKA